MSGKRKPECKNGHRRTPETTRVRRKKDGTEYQVCIVCRNESSRRGNQRRTKERQRVARKAVAPPRPEPSPAYAALMARRDVRYQQIMLEAIAEMREWDARQAAKGRSKLKVNVRREVAA